MENRIEGLRWRPMWVSHLGCVKGCLEYLRIDVSDGWLYGGTGHAFIINIHEAVCASGPTNWNTEMLHKLGRNLGYYVYGVSAWKLDDDFAEKQKRAWEMVKTAIDKKLPCYGWELDMPEYYVVYGYDDTGYYISGPGCDEGKGPIPWERVGISEIGILEMFCIKPGQAADDVKTVKDAFKFVLEHSRSPSKWIPPGYKAGLAGFDNWISALKTGKADEFGMAYNAAVWGECRRLAVEFLKEAKERIGRAGKLFDEAMKHYEVVAQNLKKVVELFPFPPKGGEVDNTRYKDALEHLMKAKDAEKYGLKSLEEILRAI